MRILVHDYAGHQFPVQLSRGLAAREHEVLHLYCGSTHTPRGELVCRPDDPSGFDIQEISLGETIPKSSFWRRYRMESAYGQLLREACLAWQPEVVLSAQTPTLPQYQLVRLCQQRDIRLVSWIQDIYGIAAHRLLRRKLPIIGDLVGRHFIRIDKTCARSSDAIVVITDDFTEVLASWSIDRSNIHVIHNWASLEKIPPVSRDNEWSRKHALTTESPGSLRFIYAGTLAMKHNPALLLELARTLDERRMGELIVVSEGDHVEWLAAQAAVEKIGSLRCLGFQPFEELPQVLGSADVLVAILEPDAGVFSVPSKVLTYLCAQRPLLLAVPKENLAARIVHESGAGLVVDPGDIRAFCQAALTLAESSDERQSRGAAARQYADSHFDIATICDRFENILAGNGVDRPLAV